MSEILRKRISTSKIYHDVIVRKTKSANILTDIDFMITLDDSVIVLQVKSKKLSEPSKRGDADKIISDSEKGLFAAYEQGKKCIECLKKQDEYYSLKKLPQIKATNYYNICITTEQYPTISSIEYIKSLELVNEEISLICMSVYDLDILFLLFKENEILEYIKFRNKCRKHAIYGLNEIYYVGLFVLYKTLNITELGYNFQISQKVCLLIDWLIKGIEYKDFIINNIDDICVLVRNCSKIDINKI